MVKKILFILIAIVVIAAAYGYRSYKHKVDLGDEVVTIIIYPGDSFSKVADSLIARGVVDSKFFLKLSAKYRGNDKKLIPGRYDFTGENSCQSVLSRLEKADFFRIKVTIPEGSTIWDVSGLLQSKLDLDSASFVSLNHNDELLQELNLPCLEGYLFPETYYFQWGFSEKDAVKTMVRRFHQQIDTLWPDSFYNNLTKNEMVILASIIEAEARVDSERVIVSSVYHNRIKSNMKLDADPTVIYGLGGFARHLYKKDLLIETPYNTYLRKGLPPTPINSPGLAAIKAALNPAETDYFFFVADNNGGHYFSKTNAEHNRAIKRIRSESKTN
ncbi:MAG: endolytic transglycosylase MltG [bacterium]